MLWDKSAQVALFLNSLIKPNTLRPSVSVSLSHMYFPLLRKESYLLNSRLSSTNYATPAATTARSKQKCNPLFLYYIKGGLPERHRAPRRTQHGKLSYSFQPIRPATLPQEPEGYQQSISRRGCRRPPPLAEQETEVGDRRYPCQLMQLSLHTKRESGRRMMWYEESQLPWQQDAFAEHISIKHNNKKKKALKLN